MNKSKIKLMVAIVIAVIAIFGFTAHKSEAATYTTSDGITWTYTITNNEATITSATGVNWQTPSPIVIPSELGGAPVTTLGSGSKIFSNGINNKGITIPNTVKTIGNSAFANSYVSEDLVIPDSVETIGTSAFEGDYIRSLTLGNGLTSIGNSAFASLRYVRGDITIPDSVTTLPWDAFKDCEADGVINFGNGIEIIEGRSIARCFKKAKKIVLGTKIRRINRTLDSMGSPNNFTNICDIFIKRTKDEVIIAPEITGGKFHFLNETHNVLVSSIPGVKVMDNSTSAEITTGDYACEKVFDVVLDIDSAYSYEDLRIVVGYGENYSSSTTYNYTPGTPVTLPELTKDIRILILTKTNEKDLVLRTFATRINNIPIESREPVINLKDGKLGYFHTKRAVQVNKNDIVTYKIRVYNEGSRDIEATKVNVFLPEGLEYISSDLTNILNGWSVDPDDSSKLTTNTLDGQLISGYQEDYNPEFRDIEIKLKVTLDREREVSTQLKMIAEIAEGRYGDTIITSDDDSTFGSITAAVAGDYKEPEGTQSTSLSYVEGTEDDDDYEAVVLTGIMKVTYDFKLRKSDIADEQLLEGATFRLYNDQKEKITDAVTDENGEIDFGTMTSYGDGQDIYYMEEILPPAGYAAIENCKIKIIVNKTLIDEVTGQCVINIVCEKSDYRVDTSRYEFIPITNRTELEKIGSGETITIDGKAYDFDANANYKLMNNIDLSSAEWTPIENEFVGIFDGNGKTITGLTITSTADYDKSEVGLFRVFSGIFENTTFEDVNINIVDFDDNADNISGKTGVGTIAGVMREGVIYNLTVSGTVVGEEIDNVGGFVGHTMPEKIVRVIDCTNNAEVTGWKNVGGTVGCSLGAISVVNSTNTGAITSGHMYGNCGGLVGYVEATDYQETLFTAAYKEDNDGNLFTLVARNEELEDGTYTMLLENRDKTSRNLIPNGVYTVYGSDKNAITGLENVTLTDGTANLGTYTFDTVGKDTYYLKEISPATGYSLLNKYIKVVVTRCWNGEEYKFYVTVEDVLLGDEAFEDDVPDDSSVEVNPKTGKTNDITEHQNVYWNVNKAEFINCSNTAAIGDDNTYHAGGILGTACKCHVEFEVCSNSGVINGKKAAGLASMITCHKYSDNTTKIDDNWSKVIDCTNTGTINGGNGKESGGLIAETNGNIKVYSSRNYGSITASNSFVGGIIGRVCGKTNIVGCRNEGVINVEYASTDSVAGGIIGGEGISCDLYHDFTDMELVIDDCTNTANVISKYHSAGIIGVSNSDRCTITNCTVGNAEGDKISIKTLEGEIGGIVASIHANKTTIRNCNIDNTDMIVIGGSEANSSGTLGDIGGIAGVVYNFDYNQSGYNTAREIVIDKCNVSNSTLGDELGDVGESNRAGIIAQMYSKTDFNAYITDCNVKNTDIANTYIAGSIYNTAGIVGISKGTGADTEIENCLVKECNITATNNTGTNSGDINTAGIVAVSQGKSMKIVNCEVNKTNITNAITLMQINDNVGGILAYSEYAYTEITDCKVTNGSTILGHEGNIGGILGNSAYETVVERCTFEDGSLSCSSTLKSGGNPNGGGIVGQATSNMTIRDCKVDNVNMNVETCNTGGILGYSMSSGSVIENCTVNETNITENYLSTNGGSLGGIGGNINGEHIINCTVKDSNFKSVHMCFGNAGLIGKCGVSLVDNCKVSGCTIETDVSTYPENSDERFVTAGLIALFGSNIDHCTVENTTVKGVSRVGGLSGVEASSIKNSTVSNVTLVGNSPITSTQKGTRVMGGVAAQSTGSFDNVKVNGLTVTGDIETFGGFIGHTESYIKDCSVKNLTATIAGVKSTDWGAVGGFAGSIGRWSNLQNVSVETATINVDEHPVGGLIGAVAQYVYGTYTYDITATINGATVKGATITHNNKTAQTYDGVVGGLIGLNTERAKISATSCNVEDSELIGNQVSGSTSILHMGGLAGFVDGDNSFTDCNVLRTKVTNNTEGMTGGACGMTQHKDDGTVTNRAFIINNVTVDGGDDTVTISGKNHVGGLLGLGKISVTAPIEVKNLVLKTLGTTGDEEVHEVIGIATDNTGVTSVTVTNVSIQ